MEYIDNSLNKLFTILLNRGITLKRKRGYKAGKLSASRNWCHIQDGETRHRLCFSNKDQTKTWKLFARFDIKKPPLWPWEKLERDEGNSVRGVISGDDVWGMAYEDLGRWVKDSGNEQILKRLTDDLQTSFNYSRQRYC
jgi:hypothetical protein